MIKDYLESLSKKNLYPFNKSSEFIYHIHDENGEFIVYFQYKVYNRIDEEKYETLKLPSNMFEISDILLRLGIIESELRYSDEGNQEEPGLLALDSNYFEKLELLEEILYNQKERENQLYLDQITNNLNKKGIRPQTIIDTLKIKDEGVFFNDIEILVHGLSIKYPEKLKDFFELITQKQEVFKTNNKIIIRDKVPKQIKIKPGTICDENDKPIMLLTKTEVIIIDFLKLLISSGGTSIENIHTKTKQTSIKSVEQSIKVLNRKIKDHNLDNLIYINKPRGINQYCLSITSN